MSIATTRGKETRLLIFLNRNPLEDKQVFYSIISGNSGAYFYVAHFVWASVTIPRWNNPFS